MGLDFSAANRRIEIPSASSIEGMTSFSAVMWIYANATAKDDGLFYRVNASNGSVYRLIYDDTSGNLQLAVWQTSDIDYVVTNDGPGASGSYRCIAVTYDTTNGPRIYSGDLNNDLTESTYGATYYGGSGGMAVHDGPLTVFNNSFVQSTRFFDGEGQTFKHFSSALTLEELIAQQWANVPHADLNIDLPVGDSGTSSQIDLSGLDNVGTIYSATEADKIPFDFNRFASGGLPLLTVAAPIEGVGSLGVSASVSSNADMIAETGATLPATAGVNGSSELVTDQGGSLGMALSMLGTKTLDTSADGSLSVTASVLATADMIAEAAASLAHNMGASAAAVIIADEDGTLTLSPDLTGSSDGAVEVVAALNLGAQMVGTVVYEGDAAGILNLTHTLGGVGVFTTEQGAALALTSGIVSQAAIISDQVGVLTASFDSTSVSELGQINVNGNLDLGLNLVGNVIAQHELGGTMDFSADVAAAAIADLIADAAMGLTAGMSANGQTTIEGIGTLTYAVSMNGDAEITATVDVNAYNTYAVTLDSNERSITFTPKRHTIQ